MKRWMKIAIGVLVALAVLVVALALTAGHIAKAAIITAGPQALGVPVSVSNVSVGLLSGRFGVEELVVGNPKGFDTPEAIRLNKVSVTVKMASLFSKTLIIDRVYVGGPEITYEIRLNGSNIGAIQEKLEPPEPSEAPPEPAAPKPSEEDRKVRINDLLIENGKIHVSTVGMAGYAMPIPLPAIHLTDIGKKSGGASVEDVIAQVFDALGDAVTEAATGIGKDDEALEP